MKFYYIILYFIFYSCSIKGEHDFNDIKFFLIDDKIGEINGLNIKIKLDRDTPINNLTPLIIISDKANIEPASGEAQDFSQSVIYTVIAENGSVKKYTAAVYFDPTYQIIYHDNNSDGGTVPTDNTFYYSNDIAVIKHNYNDLHKLNYNFKGWCADELCSGLFYAAGSLINIEDKDINLYAKWEEFECGDNLIDSRDSKAYSTVLIGSQCWLAENLNVGRALNYGEVFSNNNIIEKVCYEHNEENCDIYGALYDFKEAMNYSPSPSNPRGICPYGWRIPSENQYTTLLDFVALNSWTSAGAVLKEIGLTYWNHPNEGATNEYGFSARGTGYKYSSSFSNIKLSLYLWVYNTSAMSDSNKKILSIRNSPNSVSFSSQYPERYFSVRCLKD